jgi:hypothetical protein
MSDKQTEELATAAPSNEDELSAFLLERLALHEQQLEVD